MVKEVHEMTETLYKVRANTLNTEDFSGLMQSDHPFHSHFNDYGDDYDYYDEDGYDDEEYGIEDNKYMQKAARKNRKVSNKTNSNIITAKVKKWSIIVL